MILQVYPLHITNAASWPGLDLVRSILTWSLPPGQLLAIESPIFRRTKMLYSP